MRTTSDSQVTARDLAGFKLTMSEVVGLVSAVLILFAFVLLPWLSEAGKDVSGISLLTAAAPPVSDALQTLIQDSRWMLVLPPLGAILAFAAIAWGATGERKRLALLLARLGGLLAFGYFVLTGLQDRQDTNVALMQFSGGGFWLAFFAAVVLMAQAFMARTAGTTALTVRDLGTGGWWRSFTSRFNASPRFLRTVAFIFRFQSFFGLIIVIILAIVFSPVRNGNNLFMSQRNLSNVARDVAETGILAVGQIMVIIIGGIDLSVGSVVALTATGAAFLLMRDYVPAIPAIGIILGLGLLVGWWNGWTSERFKIPSFITTLAMLSIARGIAHIWSNDIAVPVSYGAGGADPLFGVIGERINGIFPVPAIIMFGVATIMALILQYTAFGRHLYAIGGNQVAARLSGLAVSRIKITAFMLCGFFASMAGILHAAQLNQGSPNEAVGYELNAIAAVVIGGASLNGGKGTIVGAVAGAFILGILDNMLSLNNVNSNIQLVTKGLLVVAAVALQQVRPRNSD
ncbi:MAG: ABC transporter permease [Anaerolineae bacterium]